MAKILVPETGPQLSLSFSAAGGRIGENSLPSTSARLREHIFSRVATLGWLFAPITLKAIASAIRISGAQETDFIRKGSGGISLRQLILTIEEAYPPRATVALDMNLRGPEIEATAVCQILLMMILQKAPWELRSTIVVRDGHFVVTVPIDPIARIDVGALESPPVVCSFVLHEEVVHLLPALDGLDRPYQVVVPAAA